LNGGGGALLHAAAHAAHTQSDRRADLFVTIRKTYHNGRADAVQSRSPLLMLSIIWSLWGSDLAVFTWLAVAFVAAILEVSIPHFGSAFVSAGAIAAAAAAYLGMSVPMQIGTFVVVLVVSLIGLRSTLVGRLGGRGVPSRIDALIGRHGVVTHDI